MVAMTESAELVEKGFLTSSCCPAFVSYIKKSFPDLIPLISHNPSPMAAIAKYLKETDSPCKVVFIGPCTAKKAEAQLEEVKSYVDCVLTFEELQALFDSKDIDITALKRMFLTMLPISAGFLPAAAVLRMLLPKHSKKPDMRISHSTPQPATESKPAVRR